MRATLDSLGMRASFSRPRQSDDNAFSESLFRTVNYRPEYPDGPLASLHDARAWVAAFVAWYNHEHRHSGKEHEVLRSRRQAYAAAHKRHPERWSGHTHCW